MRHMRWIIAGLALALAGCAVHDGHEGEEAPVWWPTPFYRAAPEPTTQEYDQAKAAPMHGNTAVAVADSPLGQ